MGPKRQKRTSSTIGKPSESLEQRLKGNDLFVAAHNSQFGASMMKFKLQDAIKCYNGALKSAQNDDEKASALKNIGVTSAKIFDVLTEDFLITSLKEAIYFASNALESYDKAYALKDCKPCDWGTVLLEKINSLSQEIIDFNTDNNDLTFDQSMSNIETCGLSLSNLSILRNEMLQVVAKTRFSSACKHLSDKNFQKCLHHLAECSRPLEEALKTKIEHDECLLHELLTLKFDIHHNKCVAESLQALHIGDSMLEKYINSEEELNMDMVWLVIDKYKEAILLTREKDVEVEAIAFSRLGKINDKILLNKDKAKEYYHRSIQLAFSLVPREFDQEEWFREAQISLERLQTRQQAAEDEKQRKLREPFMKEAREKVSKITDITSVEGYHVKIYEMIKFTYETYPPIHKKETGFNELDKNSDDFRYDLKKLLKSLIIDYHPDKIDEKEYGLKYKVLCEEISKIFTNDYSCIK